MCALNSPPGGYRSLIGSSFPARTPEEVKTYGPRGDAPGGVAKPYISGRAGVREAIAVPAGAAEKLCGAEEGAGEGVEGGKVGAVMPLTFCMSVAGWKRPAISSLC